MARNPEKLHVYGIISKTKYVQRIRALQTLCESKICGEYCRQQVCKLFSNSWLWWGAPHQLCLLPPCNCTQSMDGRNGSQLHFHSCWGSIALPCIWDTHHLIQASEGRHLSLFPFFLHWEKMPVFPEINYYFRGRIFFKYLWDYVIKSYFICCINCWYAGPRVPALLKDVLKKLLVTNFCIALCCRAWNWPKTAESKRHLAWPCCSLVKKMNF